MRTSLLDLFPTPKYLAPPVLGLDISDNGIKFVELIRHRGGIELGRFGERPLSADALVNGKIQKADEITEVLSALHAELRLRTAMVSVMEEQGYLLRLKIPVKTEAEIREGIELQLEEHIPIPPGQAVFDYDVIATPTAAAPFYEVAVCAFPEESVGSYYEIVSKSGFEPLALEIESQSVARAVVPRDDLGTCMVIDLGRTRTGVAVVSDGVVAFSSTIALGGENFTSILQKELQLSRDKAEELKLEKGISRGSDSKNLFSFFVPLLSVFREEVGKQYAYWHSHPYESGAPRKKIERIVMCGRGANMKGVADYFSSALGVPVTIANPWANSISFSRVIPDMTLQDSLGYAAAIGLALRGFDAEGMHVINL